MDPGLAAIVTDPQFSSMLSESQPAQPVGRRTRNIQERRARTYTATDNAGRIGEIDARLKFLDDLPKGSEARRFPGQRIRLESDRKRFTVKLGLETTAARDAAQASAKATIKAKTVPARVNKGVQRVQNALDIKFEPPGLREMLGPLAQAGDITESAINDVIERVSSGLGIRTVGQVESADERALAARRKTIEGQKAEQKKAAALHERNVSRATGLHRQVHGKAPDEETQDRIDKDPVQEIAALQGGRRGQKISAVSGKVGSMLALSGQSGDVAKMVGEALGLGSAFVSRASQDPEGFRTVLNAMIAEDPDRMEAVVNQIEKAIAEKKRAEAKPDKQAEARARLEKLTGGG